MPQTVPKRPTNGAVEPTVARNARPSCSLDCTSSTERCTLMVTQVLRSMFSVSAPSWWSLASMPDSAMKRKALPSLGVLAASAMLACLKKPRRAGRDSALIFRLSYSLVTRMYQLPMDMTTRMMSVPLATKSPCAHSADRPYGLSTVSLVVVATGGGGTGVPVAVSAAALAAAGALAGGWAGGRRGASEIVGRGKGAAANQTIKRGETGGTP